MPKLTLPNKTANQSELLRKRSQHVQEIMEEQGYNPIEALIDMAADKNITDPEIKFKVHKELAGYYAPKLRSVDLTGGTDNSVTVKIKQFTQNISNQPQPQHQGNVIEITPTKGNNDGD